MVFVCTAPQETDDMIAQFLQDNGDKVAGLAVQLAVDDLIWNRLMECFLVEVRSVVDGELLPSLSVSAQNIFRLLDDPLKY